MIPNGYVLLPEKPTKAMIEAGKKAGAPPRQLHALRNPQNIYDAMLKAAPQPWWNPEEHNP